MEKDMKKVVNLILLIVWMIVIFLFSSANPKESLETSDKVIDVGINITENISGNKVSSENKEKPLILHRYRM